MEALTNVLETITKGRWEWRSNPDPWSETEEPRWELYSLEHNYLIEKAYYDQRKEVDLGDYLIYPAEMLQRKKEKPDSQRPIRRVNWMDDEEMNDRSARFFETELPKTINSIFGSLGDFVNFFSRRNPEILEFTSQFKEVEQSKNVHILNVRVVPRLIECLREVLLKPRLEQLQDHSLTLFKKKMLLKRKEAIEKLIDLFKRQFFSFEQFYEQILKAYTMNTDLYPILNDSLRNESWVGLDKLLPYAFCLCKAFFNLKLNTSSIQNHQIIGSQSLSPLTLYRGATFDGLSLSLYNREKIPYFSWNAVTSTSKDKKIAEDFMYRNADIANKKYPVMFDIEIPPPSQTIPKEDEVVLAPGSVFELAEVYTDQDQKTTIQLKLRNEIRSLVLGGMMMQGAFQSQMTTEKEAKIMCLEGEELDQAVMSLCGNELIEEVEFCLCTFDKKSVSKIFEILPTLERARILKFISCMSQENEKITIEGPKKGEKCGILRIEILEANDFFQMICNQKWNQEYWESLRELDINFKSSRLRKVEELECLVAQGLPSFIQLTSLKINLETCNQTSDEVLKTLAQTIHSQGQLKYLNLNFRNCHSITDEGVKSLAQGLSFRTHLTHLNLNFKLCCQITDEGVHSFVQTLNSLSKLTHLNLDFENCFKITDGGLRNLAHRLTSLKYLTYLHLDFRHWQITDSGVIFLAHQLRFLKSLMHLNLNLESCLKLTRRGVIDLISGEFKNLAQLKSLTLNFPATSKITDKEIQQEACKHLKHLLLFPSLIVENRTLKNTQTQPETQVFSRVRLLREISHSYNQTLYEALARQKTPVAYELSKKRGEVLPYNLFQTLVSILAKSRDQVDNADFALKTSEILSEINHLTTLNLYFQNHNNLITDGFLYNLAFQLLRNSPQLRSLTLDFSRCDQITDKGVSDLASIGLKALAELKSLYLDFSGRSKITKKGATDLAQEGLRHLFQLKSLILKFGGDFKKVEDEGLINLASYGLSHLPQLEFFSLDISSCSTITNDGIDGFVLKGLKYLSELKFLILDLTSSKITEKEVNKLILRVVRNIPKLIFLDINFAKCEGINEFTIQNLIKVLNFFIFAKEIDAIEVPSDLQLLQMSRPNKGLSQPLRLVEETDEASSISKGSKGDLGNNKKFMQSFRSMKEIKRQRLLKTIQENSEKHEKYLNPLYSMDESEPETQLILQAINRSKEQKKPLNLSVLKKLSDARTSRKILEAMNRNSEKQNEYLNPFLSMKKNDSLQTQLLFKAIHGKEEQKKSANPLLFTKKADGIKESLYDKMIREQREKQSQSSNINQYSLDKYRKKIL